MALFGYYLSDISLVLFSFNAVMFVQVCCVRPKIRQEVLGGPECGPLLQCLRTLCVGYGYLTACCPAQANL